MRAAQERGPGDTPGQAGEGHPRESELGQKVRGEEGWRVHRGHGGHASNEFPKMAASEEFEQDTVWCVRETQLVSLFPNVWRIR